MNPHFLRDERVPIGKISWAGSRGQINEFRRLKSELDGVTGGATVRAVMVLRSPGQPVGAVEVRSAAARRFWAAGCTQLARRWGLGGCDGQQPVTAELGAPSAGELLRSER